MIEARRRTLLATLLATGLVAVWPAAFPLAQERKLSAAEIEDKLIGNTVQGLWQGRPYLQFFDGSGNTFYQEEGRAASLGKWWVDAEDNTYCSSREGSRSACYEVHDGGRGAIFWVVPNSSKKFPATVLQGNQLPTVTQDDPVF